MAYDAELAERLRALLAGQPTLREMTMFGGLAFLVNGHMAVAASGGGGLLLRCDPERSAEYTSQPHVGRFEMRGRAMAGWLRVDPAAVGDDAALRRWVDVGLAYVRSLPPK
jgi:hypothetical protein